MTLFPHQIEALAQRLLVAAGASRENAHRAAQVFRRATTKGIGHHDLTYLPSRLNHLVGGRIDGRAEIRLLHSAGAVEIYDGANGLGESNCYFITLRALELAAQQGLGLCSIRHSNHFLAGLPYSEIVAEAGFLGLVWSNTDASMTSPEGSAMVIGNNPISYGCPADTGLVLFDACMAYASLGTLAALGDRPVPPYWGFDANGRPANTAKEILQGGAGRPIGDHKGFGLALLHEFLTAGLNGGEWGAEAVPLSGGIGVHSQTVLVIGIPSGAEDLKSRVRHLREIIEARDARARLPGDRSLRFQSQVAEIGWNMPEELENKLRDWCGKLGLTWDEVAPFSPDSTGNP